MPGVAETIDWAGALAELDKVALDPETVSDTIGVLLKYQDDIARIEAGEGEGASSTRSRPSSRRRSERDDAGPDPREADFATEAAASPTTSSISPARCATPACRSGRPR